MGATFLVGGIATLIQSFQEKEWGGVFWQLAIGIVYLAGGVVFLVNPFGGVIALTVFLGIIFFVEGIARMIMGFQMRSERNWGWLVASGAMSMLLGILVFGGLANGASLGFIGVLLGVNFIFAGASFVALGSAKADTVGRCRPKRSKNRPHDHKAGPSCAGGPATIHCSPEDRRHA